MGDFRFLQPLPRLDVRQKRANVFPSYIFVVMQGVETMMMAVGGGGGRLRGPALNVTRPADDDTKNSTHSFDSNHSTATALQQFKVQ